MRKDRGGKRRRDPANSGSRNIRISDSFFADDALFGHLAELGLALPAPHRMGHIYASYPSNTDEKGSEWEAQEQISDCQGTKRGIASVLVARSRCHPASTAVASGKPQIDLGLAVKFRGHRFSLVLDDNGILNHFANPPLRYISVPTRRDCVLSRCAGARTDCVNRADANRANSKPPQSRRFG